MTRRFEVNVPFAPGNRPRWGGSARGWARSTPCPDNMRDVGVMSNGAGHRLLRAHVRSRRVHGDWVRPRLTDGESNVPREGPDLLERLVLTDQTRLIDFEQMTLLNDQIRAAGNLRQVELLGDRSPRLDALLHSAGS